MPTEVHKLCPHCETMWDPEERRTQTCKGCGYPDVRDKKIVLHMTDQTCPNCEVSLFDVEVIDGQCYLCGQKLPKGQKWKLIS